MRTVLSVLSMDRPRCQVARQSICSWGSADRSATNGGDDERVGAAGHGLLTFGEWGVVVLTSSQGTRRGDGSCAGQENQRDVLGRADGNKEGGWMDGWMVGRKVMVGEGGRESSAR